MTLAYLAWIAVCILWGTTYLAIRVALESIPVALLAGMRWLVAGAILAAIVPLLGQRVPPLRMWRSIAIIGFLMAVVGNGGVVWAQQFVASGLAAVVVAMVPFWSVIVEALLPNGERVTGRTMVGLVVGFLGIVVLVWPELTLGGQQGRQFVYGVIALQIACAGWALGTSYLKRNPTNGSPLGSLALQMLLSGVMLIAIGTAIGEWHELSFTPRTLAAMAYLVLFGSLLGYTAYMYALKNLPVSTVSLYAYVNPVIAVVLGSVVLAEPFTMRIVVASTLVFSGIAIVRRRSRSTGFTESAALETPTTPADPCKTPGPDAYATR
ncbi:MAG TPA: EamA family transporter [Vicinamibacterales bacterium]|nr:EamA family transporter [Vicinamibacterales bacterium]